MPLHPLYFDAKEKLKDVVVELTEEQEETRARDREYVKAIDQYYQPYRERWRQNGALFNLIQQGTDDVVSNWYMGWARLLINHAQALLSAGDPKGAFEPIGNMDYKMGVLVSALVEDSLVKCNWHAHQRLWIQDLLTFGNGVTKSYAETPVRRKTFLRKGQLVQKIVRDLRRSKVGIRRKSPFRCMRSHFISDPDDVPYSVEIEEGTYNQYVTRYADVILLDGTKKYDTDQIPVGSHYRAVHLYDENENCYRTYMITYGQTPEATLVPEVCPGVHELGYPIYNQPLSRYRFKNQGREISGGANVPGMSPLAFATLDDQLDADMETYSIIGMGIPQIIEGPEAVMHGLMNMSIDNERLANTVLVGYEPNSPKSPSALDLDVRQAYSGLVADGKITTAPLGRSTAGANEVLWNWLKFVIYQLTGINPEPLTGDQLHTAYQSGLLVRQMNMRAKARLNQWCNGPLKRAFMVHAANCLSEVTVEEWEEITEDDAREIQERIKNDEMTAEDYKEEDEDGETIYKKRKPVMIPVKGYKFREDFKGENKKRTLNADSVDNTLIEDPKMKGNVSFVPASEKYLLPSGSVESIFEFNLRVIGDPMLQDLKTQDMEMGAKLIGNAQAVGQLDVSGEFLKTLDTKKLFMSSIEPTGKTEEDVFKTESEQSALLAAFKKADEEIDKEVINPPQNAQAIPGVPPQPAAQAGVEPNAARSGPQEPGGQPANNPALRGIAG